jgi:hypothetical protein
MFTRPEILSIILIATFFAGALLGQWVWHKYQSYKMGRDFWRKWEARKKELDEEWNNSLLKAMEQVAPQVVRSLKERKENKERFVVKYKDLCAKAFKSGTDHKDYKSEAGRELVELARRLLVFKDSTYAGDIYVGLWFVYDEQFSPKK